MNATESAIGLHVDNHSSSILASQPTYGCKTWHIKLKWHYIRGLVRNHEVVIIKVPTEDNPANLLTRPLTNKSLDKLTALIGMCDVEQASWEGIGTVYWAFRNLAPCSI